MKTCTYGCSSDEKEKKVGRQICGHQVIIFGATIGLPVGWGHTPFQYHYCRLTSLTGLTWLAPSERAVLSLPVTTRPPSLVFYGFAGGQKAARYGSSWQGHCNDHHDNQGSRISDFDRPLSSGDPRWIRTERQR